MGTRPGFIAELQRRKVFRAVAWYGGVAAAATQVLDLIANRFALPPQLMQGVILVGLAGLPIVAVVSWFFDVGRGGIDLTPDAPPDAPVATKPAWTSASLWLALVAGALLLFGSQQAWRAFVAPSERPGIAVLAFDAMGVESNRALAGGLHEAVLNELAAMSGLRVIARTSVLRFADEKPDIREVGRILDVPFVLEGSVLREGNRMRVHAQLIDAATNEHIWSQSYDRDVTDLFGVQSALARDIAHRLRVTLLPDEAKRGERPPTADPEAFAAYLRGTIALSDAQQIEDDSLRGVLERGLAELDEAVARDPSFAAAHAARAEVLISLWYHLRRGAPELDGHRELALQAATEALRLAPNLGEAHRALGLYHYWGHFDFPKAEREFLRARELLPNEARTRVLLGYMYRRQGRVDEMLTLLEEAVRTDPENAEARGNLVWQAYMMQRYTVADAMLTELSARFPDDRDLIASSGPIGFCRSGDPGSFLRAAARLGEDPRRSTMSWVAAWFTGDHRAALKALEGRPDSSTVAIFYTPVARGMSLRFLGENAAAAAAVAEHVRHQELELRRLEQDPTKSEPARYGALGELAISYWAAGRDDDARRAPAQGPDPLPSEIYPFDRAAIEQYAMLVYGALGDIELGMMYLRRFQEGPGGHCEQFLRRHPMLASLRSHPDFEALARASAWPTRGR